GEHFAVDGNDVGAGEVDDLEFDGDSEGRRGRDARVTVGGGGNFLQAGFAPDVDRLGEGFDPEGIGLGDGEVFVGDSVDFLRGEHVESDGDGLGLDSQVWVSGLHGLEARVTGGCGGDGFAEFVDLGGGDAFGRGVEVAGGAVGHEDDGFS